MNGEIIFCPICGKNITFENTVQAYYDDVMNDPEMGEEEKSAAADEYESVDDKTEFVQSVHELGCWCNNCKDFFDIDDAREKAGHLLSIAQSERG